MSDVLVPPQPDDAAEELAAEAEACMEDLNTGVLRLADEYSASAIAFALCCHAVVALSAAVARGEMTKEQARRIAAQLRELDPRQRGILENLLAVMTLGEPTTALEMSPPDKLH